MRTDWDVYGVCPCGYYVVAPFGELFHIWAEVCPICGTPKSKWSKEIAREKCSPVKHHIWIFSWTGCDWTLEIQNEV